jgi:ParB family chromosome partitioning protein
MTTNAVAEHDTTTVDDITDVVEPVDPTPEQSYPYLKHNVDPRDLRAQDNSREVGDIRVKRPELVASVAQHGLDPKVSVVNVAEDTDDGLRVLVGFHRTAAAVAVKELENPDLLITVLVHPPGTTRQDMLVAQGIENFHREGYTQAEEAGLYEQLSLSGLDTDAIAQTLSRNTERVKAGLAVAATPRTRAASEAMPDTDLLALAPLTEFADDEQVHQHLVEVLNTDPRNFEFALGQARRAREQRATLIEEVQRFTELGYTIVDTHDLPDDVAPLDELCTGEDTTPLDPDGHADCPGRAVQVWVDRSRRVDVTHFCVQFTEHGHRTIASATIAATEERLRAAGVPIVDPDAEDVADLSDLFADEQAERSLTVEEHADCPGHAAYVEHEDYWLEPDVHYVCIDYTAHGHVLRSVRAPQPEPDNAFKAAERKRAEENNKQWRDAKIDRREWLGKYFAEWRTKAKDIKLPARVHHWLALAEVLAGDYLSDAAPVHRYACTLLKLTEPKGQRRDLHPITVQLRKKSTTEAQAILIRLALVVGACEEHWDLAYTDKSADASWRRPSEDTRFYFELLAALGYPLSYVEQLVNNPELDQEKWPHLVPADTEDATAA